MAGICIPPAAGIRNAQQYSEAIRLEEVRSISCATQLSLRPPATNYSAYVPDLPGCVATGSTPEETETAIREAIEFHLEGMREDGTPVPPRSSRVEYVEVAA